MSASRLSFARLAAGLVLAAVLSHTPVLAQDQPGEPLPGTAAWDVPKDPAAEMVRGIHRFLDRELAASIGRRQEKWTLDVSSPEAYTQAVARNRERFVRRIGATGQRVAPVVVSLLGTTDSPAQIGEAEAFTVTAVRWSVYPGVDAEGLLLNPKREARANAIVMADCDVPPEAVAGLVPGLDPQAQTARLLAEAGCRVLVPTLLDRADTFSGSPNVRMTNLTHREWVYRMAYEVGRHVIGYEVDKVRAAVDWFNGPGQPRLPTGVVGHGEGGLIAFYAAAADTRIDAAWVGAYFGPREDVWQEPVYRNVWGLLDEFGDAELVRLVAPRKLLVESCKGPEVAGPPPAREGRNDAASGKLTTRKASDVRAEWDRALAWFPKTPRPAKALRDGLLAFGLDDTGAAVNQLDLPREAFLNMLGIAASPSSASAPKLDPRAKLDARARMQRQVQQLVDYTQNLARTSELRRDALWSKADQSSPAKWSETTDRYRQQFWDEVIGRFPAASEPLEASTRQVMDEPGFRGYAVRLPVWPDVFAYGVLLVPKDIKPGEKRPVVVCQHGLEGTPEPVVNPKLNSPYHGYGARLADRGYIVFAPQNPYIGHDTFRQLLRKANPLAKTLFAVIVRQHERIIEWLGTLPQVDGERIAFYGISYGGKTAMRVPALLKGYCLSICSADFNEWVVKCTNVDRKYSYMYTLEYDMYEFNLAEGFNYAEMAGLIAPRPFQVERGHGDGVAPDEWVGYEYAKVKRLYDALGIGDRTEITYFNGPHEIRGEGTFAFLARHLNWPRGLEAPKR